MLQPLNQSLAAAGLLLIAARARRHTAGGEVSFAGRLKTVPLLTIVFVVMALALASVPALGGFVGAAMVVRGVHAVDQLSAAAAAALVISLSACTVWFLRRTLSAAGSADPGNMSDLGWRDLAVFAPLVLLTFWVGLHPAPFVAILETSMGRTVARVDPAYAPHLVLGSDCATPAPPQPTGPPAGFMLTDPCADGSQGTEKPAAPDGRR